MPVGGPATVGQALLVWLFSWPHSPICAQPPSTMAVVADHELTAVCQFLNELSLDEIYRLDLATCDDAAPASDDSVCSDDETDSSSSTVTGVTTDEGSDVEDPPRSVALASSRKRAAGQPSATESPTKKKRVPKSELQRARQRVYDKNPGPRAVVAQGPVRDVCARARALRGADGEARGADRGGAPIAAPRRRERRRQCAAPAHFQQWSVNERAIKLSNEWLLKWSENRSTETGKFFMRGQAKEIELEMERLAAVGEQLASVQAELRWRLGGPTLTFTF